MKNAQHQISKAGASRCWHWGVVGLGVLAITVLLYAFVSTARAHMDKAAEVSRDSQWLIHAPVEGAHAAALLQGVER